MQYGADGLLLRILRIVVRHHGYVVAALIFLLGTTLYLIWPTYPRYSEFGLLGLLGLVAIYILVIIGRSKTAGLTSQSTNAKRRPEKDLSDRRQTEAAILANDPRYKTLFDSSEQLYRLLVQNVAVGINVLSSDFTILSVNEAMCRMFHVRSEDFIGKKCYHEFEKRDAPCEGCPGIAAMATGQMTSAERMGVRNDGSTFYGRIGACPLSDENGNVTGFIELVEDITEYKNVQEALSREIKKTTQYATELAEKNQLLEREITERKQAEAEIALREFAVNSITDEAFLIDSTSRLVYVNNQTCRALKYTRDELLRLCIPDIDPDYPAERWLTYWKELELQRSLAFESHHMTKDGYVFPVEISTNYFEYNGQGYCMAIARDITERKRMEELLRTSERRYRLLAENLSDVIWMMDFSGRFTYFSSSVTRLLGYEWKDNEDFRLERVFTPESLILARSALDEIHAAAKSGQRIETRVMELEQIRKDGSTIWTEVTIDGRYDESGRLIGIQGVTRDIGERRRLESAIRESNDRYRQLVDKTDTGFVVVDENGIVLEANEPYLRLVGATTMDQVVGHSVIEWTVPEEQGNNVAAVALCARQGYIQDFETIYQWRDGPQVHILIDATLHEISGRKCLVALCRNITERKQIENERTLAAHRMESLLALSHMADKPMNEIIATVVEESIRLTQSDIGYLATLNKDESILTMQYWSKTAHAMCKVIDKPIVYPLETTGLWGEAVRQRRPIVTNDYAAPNPLKRGMPEGHVPVARHMNTPVFDGQRIVAIAGVGNKSTDYDDNDLRQLQLLMEGWWRIAKQKQYELDLAQARDVAEAANQAKNEFLANMSHEIRSPLTAIFGYADIMLEESRERSEREHAAIIKRNGEHLLGLINDVLDISKVEAGKLTIDRIRCSPIRLIAEVMSLMRIRAETKRLTLDVDFIGPIPETILTDPLRLRQILVNLIGNAAKFTDHGGIRLAIRSTIEDGAPRLQVDVIDTGIGMSEEQVGNLFQRFMQVDESSTRRSSGTGLGLYLSKGLAEALGGTIKVHSHVGKGSTFSVTIDPGSLDGIPMVENAHEALLNVAYRAIADMVVLSGPVLLVEDGPDNQRLISLFLRKAGAEVTVVENGRLAVDAALTACNQDNPFRLILMDIQMPVMDGYTATRELRSRGYTAPIVALTANAMADDIKKCLDAGCDDYATKPIDREKFLTTVARWMNRDRAKTMTSDPSFRDNTTATT